MFKKANRYDEDTLFYFDKHDSKHVAKEGSIAWRANNPGLILSRHPLAKIHNVIGAHHQIAIFPSIKHGMAAFRDWLTIPKYRHSIFEIAKYYQPDTHNYISIGDFVPRLAASATLALLAIR